MTNYERLAGAPRYREDRVARHAETIRINRELDEKDAHDRKIEWAKRRTERLLVLKADHAARKRKQLRRSRRKTEKQQLVDLARMHHVKRLFDRVMKRYAPPVAKCPSRKSPKGISMRVLHRAERAAKQREREAVRDEKRRVKAARLAARKLPPFPYLDADNS